MEKTLLTIQEADVVEDPVVKPQTYTRRHAARTVTINEEGLVAVLFVGKHGCIKLPGGGIDSGETILEGLQRECLEEIGYRVTDIRELGKTEEYRDTWGVHQTSYAYLSRIGEGTGVPQFDAEELADGFEVQWMTIEEARTRFQDNPVSVYQSRFIVPRDRAIFLAAMEQLAKQGQAA